MALTNSEQLLAEDCVRQLGDNKKSSFGMMMRLIKKYGENKIRSVLSEVIDDYRRGGINNKVKVFLYRLSQNK